MIRDFFHSPYVLIRILYLIFRRFSIIFPKFNKVIDKRNGYDILSVKEVYKKGGEFNEGGKCNVSHDTVGG